MNENQASKWRTYQWMKTNHTDEWKLYILGKVIPFDGRLWAEILIAHRACRTCHVHHNAILDIQRHEHTPTCTHAARCRIIYMYVLMQVCMHVCVHAYMWMYVYIYVYDFCVPEVLGGPCCEGAASIYRRLAVGDVCDCDWSRLCAHFVCVCVYVCVCMHVHVCVFVCIYVHYTPLLSCRMCLRGFAHACMRVFKGTIHRTSKNVCLRWSIKASTLLMHLN
jgi:hypothetical protein